MDRLQAMQIYVQVVERGSFTQAAEALQLHRPLVTKAVQQLEHELGIRLLNRSTRKVSATAEGNDFYLRCAQLIAGVDDTFSSFTQTTSSPQGLLRLDIAVTLAKAVVAPALPDFIRRYPQIEIILGASDQPVDLVAEGIDCVLRLGVLKDSSMIARQIGQVQMVTCASPQYLAAHGAPASVDDLRTHKVINFFSGSGKKQVEWVFMEQGELRHVTIPSHLTTGNSETLAACAVAGLGIIQGVRPALEPYLQSNLLVEVLPTIPAVPKPVSVMYPDRSHMPAKTRLFIEWIVALVGAKCPITR